jgi:hypothetical protein
MTDSLQKATLSETYRDRKNMLQISFNASVQHDMANDEDDSSEISDKCMQTDREVLRIILPRGERGEERRGEESRREEKRGEERRGEERRGEELRGEVRKEEKKRRRDEEKKIM